MPADDPVVMAMDRAVRVLAEVDLTVEDLPRIRDQLARETYGDEFMDELGRERAAFGKREVGESD